MIARMEIHVALSITIELLIDWTITQAGENHLRLIESSG